MILGIVNKGRITDAKEKRSQWTVERDYATRFCLRVGPVFGDSQSCLCK